MAEDKKTNHNITILDRSSIKITGVSDVISFDEEMVVGDTEYGVLILKGINFHVNKLNLDSGILEIDGELYSLMYEDKTTYGKVGGGVFSKIFK